MVISTLSSGCGPAPPWPRPRCSRRRWCRSAPCRSRGARRRSAPAARCGGRRRRRCCPGLEGDGQGEADAAGGAGDEDGVSGDVHGPSSRRVRRRAAESTHRGIGDPWLRVRAGRDTGRMDRAALAGLPATPPGGRCDPEDVGLPAGARRRTRRAASGGGRVAGGDVHRLLHAAGAAARSAAERADAGRAGPRAAPDRRTSATTCSGWPAAPPRPRPRPRRTWRRRCCGCWTG